MHTTDAPTSSRPSVLATISWPIGAATIVLVVGWLYDTCLENHTTTAPLSASCAPTYVLGIDVIGDRGGAEHKR